MPQRLKHLMTLLIAVLFLISIINIAIKASDDPEHLWSKVYDSNNSDKAQGVDIDSENNIIVTGFVKTVGTTYILNIKYDSNGNKLFQVQYNPESPAESYDVAIDSNNNFIVSGFINNGGNLDFLIIKYNPDGTKLWNKTLDYSDHDIAYGITVDSNDNIILVGKANAKIKTVKMDENGIEQWNQSFNSTGEGCAKAVTVDAYDNIIVAGQQTNNSARDWLIIKYDSYGSILWTKNYSNGDYNNANGVAVDSANNILVVGTQYDGATTDFHLIKYNENGGIIFDQTFDQSLNDGGIDVEFNSRDEIFMIGSAFKLHEDKNYVLMKLDLNGNPVWDMSFDRQKKDDYATGIAIDALNKIIISGFSMGNDDYDFLTMQIGGLPTADFTYNPLNPSRIDTINFKDKSIDHAGEIISWNWDFGDGNTSTLKNPTHQYSLLGTFVVSLVITDDNGNQDSITKSIEIVNKHPEANFDFEITDPITYIANFNDLSIDLDGEITTWQWDFGDGNNTFIQNPIHQYSSPGLYTVSLSVTDDFGQSDSISKPVDIQNNQPIVDFNFEIINRFPYTIQFSDLSQDLDGVIVNWTWDLGNGNNSFLQNPIQQYTQHDIYQVELTVEDDYGDQTSITYPVDVTNQEPNAEFSYLITNNLLKTVEFSDLSTDIDGSINNWTWDFGDGINSFEKNCNHQFADYDNYEVVLTVCDDDEETDEFSQQIKISAPIPPKVQNLEVNDAKDGKLELNWEEITGDYIDYYRIYRDGVYLVKTKINYFIDKTLENDKTYRFQVSAVNVDGIEGEKSDNSSGTPHKSSYGGTVVCGGDNSYIPNKKPIADASAGEPYVGFANEIISFNGSKSYDPDGNITSYYWDFGDGNTGSGKITNHSYPESGTYNVILEVEDDQGKKSSYNTQAEIRTANRPPSDPVIEGIEKGKVDITYSFKIQSIDLDNDTIKYQINWDDGTQKETNFTDSGTILDLPHNWSKFGIYVISVNATDGKTISNTTEKIIYINIWKIEVNGEIIGYLIDNNNDSIYDTFFSYQLKNETMIKTEDNKTYFIDSNGDNLFDYIYNSEDETIEKYSSKASSPDKGKLLLIILPWLFFILILILMLILLGKPKRKKDKPVVNLKPGSLVPKIKTKQKIKKEAKKVFSPKIKKSYEKDFLTLSEIEAFVDNLPDFDKNKTLAEKDTLDNNINIKKKNYQIKTT